MTPPTDSPGFDYPGSPPTSFRLDLAYDGSGFHGWAAQPGLRTVEGTLHDAIAQALDLLHRPGASRLTVAGRTDAGVHARAQVAQLVAPAEATAAPALYHQLARLLPADIALHRLAPAPPGFDARFSATGRTYCYRLWDADSKPFPAIARVVTVWPGPLDTGAMAQAAASLTGQHDFVAFCRPREQATTIRHLRRFDVSRPGDPCGTIECWLEADAFCHSMVRSLVGAVAMVAAGRRSLAWLAQVAAAGQRAGDVPVLAPGGLTLEAVGYPPDDQLAARAAQARQRRQTADAWGCP